MFSNLCRIFCLYKNILSQHHIFQMAEEIVIQSIIINHLFDNSDYVPKIHEYVYEGYKK